MMVERVVLPRRVLVAGRADLVTGKLQADRMRIMTICAFDSLVKHLALNERTVNIILVPDLTVGVIDLIGDQLSRKVVIKIAARQMTTCNLGST